MYFDYQLIDARTGKILVDRVCDKTNSKSCDEEWIDHCKYEPYKDWKGPQMETCRPENAALYLTMITIGR